MANIHRPLFIILRGVPGSGKSFIAHALVDELGSSSVVLLDPDATDYQGAEYLDLAARLKEEGVDEKFYPYRFLRARAHAGIEQDKIIIWNQAFTNLDGLQKTVVNLQNYARDHGKDLPVLVIEVEVDEQTARTRVADRVKNGGHAVTEEAFLRFFSEYRSFADEGFTTVQIDGSADVRESLRRIMDALGDLA